MFALGKWKVNAAQAAVGQLGNRPVRRAVAPLENSTASGGKHQPAQGLKIGSKESFQMNAIQSISEPQFTTDEERWSALCARNPDADGSFIYGVSTTGVYCRPSCPARRPRRENVTFYPGALEAEAAGFRPCKRCRPGDQPLAERQAALVAKVCRMIEDAFETPSLDELAAGAGISPFHLHRLFKRFTGLTPRAYGAAKKAERIKRELERGREVTHAIYAAGYGSSSRFYEHARSRLGMAPTSYKAGGKHEQIRFAVGECSLGHVLVAATDKGICEVRLGDDPQRLVEELQDRFSGADLVGGDAEFEQAVQIVVSHIESPREGASALPLDVRGTAFQQRVWEALSQIPPGSTASYAEIAASIGQPSATRAVAQACGANRIAVLIPCHRVIRTDGSEGGYRWGIERKRALLAREARAAHG
jgi:AraC family transcriptional regulator of adaptative response/methylated-DNA-[protein]-cysteine methyltransferase